ncbi:hypothetical protein CCYA_CCYA20G4799 [Cyanidiococcus yangmingshanensis]|nr:hypothetical protein CCYA_CCYA20G4799 [Cyanidiococcus yangmingshanensis]
MQRWISSALEWFRTFSLYSATTPSSNVLRSLLPVVASSRGANVGLLGRILLAVPKKKVSHSRKGMRASGKGLRPYPNVQQCPECGTFHLPHRLCPKCGLAPVKRRNRLAGLEQLALFGSCSSIAFL